MTEALENLNAKLTRRQAAEALRARGFPVSPATLSTLASRGGGPIFQRFGRTPLYRLHDLIDWAEKRLSKPIRSSSELEQGV